MNINKHKTNKLTYLFYMFMLVVLGSSIVTATTISDTTSVFNNVNISGTIRLSSGEVITDAYNETKVNETIIAITDARDSDTTYTNSTGLSLVGTTFSITLSYFQGLFTELTDFLSPYLYNNAGTITFNETKLNATSRATVSDQDIYLLNTGDSASGNYAFDTNTLYIDATGNAVGLGTASPNAHLDVVGTGATTAVEIQQDGSGTSLNILNGGTGNFIVVDTNKLILDNSGNLNVSGYIAASNYYGIDAGKVSAGTFQSGTYNMPTLNVTSQFTTVDPYIDVRAFGAVGDGVNDDSVALQEAIDAGASSNKKVHIPEGVYKVSLQGTKYALDIPNNAIIYGDGMFKTTLIPDYSVSGDDFSIFKINSSNVTISHLGINGNKAQQAYSSAENDQINIKSEGYRVTIDNVYVGFSAQDAIDCDDGSFVVIKNSLIENNSGVGIHLTGSLGGCSNVEVYNNIIQHNGFERLQAGGLAAADASGIDNGGVDNNIYNNQILHNARNLLIHSATRSNIYNNFLWNTKYDYNVLFDESSASDIVLNNNLFRGNSSSTTTAIYLNATSDSLSIRNNKFIVSSKGILLNDANSDNVAIKNNEFRVVSRAIEIQSIGNDWSVKGNDFQDIDYFVWVEDGDGSVIANTGYDLQERFVDFRNGAGSSNVKIIANSIPETNTGNAAIRYFGSAIHNISILSNTIPTGTSFSGTNTGIIRKDNIGVGLENNSMLSPDGTVWECGVNNTGIFSCS